MPNTLGDALAVKVITPAAPSTLLRAFANPDWQEPKPPLSPNDIDPNPKMGKVISNPNRGLRRRIGVYESPAKKHDRLYRRTRIPRPTTLGTNYRPTRAFAREDNLTPEQRTALFANPNNRKKVDRLFRDTVRENVITKQAQALAHSGLAGPRLNGLAYLRSRKAVPTDIRGTWGTRTSLQVSRDLRVTGKLPGTNNIPAMIADRIQPVPPGTNVGTNIIPNAQTERLSSTTGALSVYKPEDVQGMNTAGAAGPPKKDNRVAWAIGIGILVILLALFMRRGGI